MDKRRWGKDPGDRRARSETPETANEASDVYAQVAEPDVYAQVGEHVAGVIRAAEAGAAELADRAAKEAKALRESAELEATGIVNEAQRAAEELTKEARALREAAEADASHTREESKTYAETRRREADEEAITIVAAAHGAAGREVQEARARKEAHARAVAQTEERLAQLAGGLHELANHLDELLARDEQSVEQALDEALTTVATARTNQ